MIELHLLGTIDMRRSGGPPLESALRGAKRVAFLGYLAAARPRGFHRRDKLAALFWPELPESRARGALRTTLARLRDDLGEDVFVKRGAAEVAVDPALLSCDVCLMDAALEAGRVTDAADFYRGDLFDGVHVEGVAEEFEHWISTERARIRNALIAALLDQAAIAESRGEQALAISLLKRSRLVAPGDETAARSLMRLLVESGDRGSALGVFDDLSDRLRREFQVEPSEATRRLVSTVRSAGARGANGDPPAAQRPARTDSRTEPNAALRADPNSLAAGTAPHSLPTPVPRRRLTWRFAVVAAVTIVAVLVTVARWRPTATAAAASAGAHWIRMSASSPVRPAPRTLAPVVLDSTGDGLLLMYGMSPGTDADHSPLQSDVWRLSGLHPNESTVWAKLAVAPGPAPAPRWGFALSYDAAHDRAIMHGGALGHSSPCASDTWILDHASGIGAAPAWRAVRTRGPRPQPHGNVAGAYDAGARRLIVFGGHDCFSTYFGDAWILAFDDSTLSSGRWTRVAPDTSGGAPFPRVASVVAFDAASNRLFVHGGTTGAAIVSDLWMLDHANGAGGTPAWHALHCAGDAPALANHFGALDDSAGTLVLVAGTDPARAERNTVWRATGLRDGGRHCAWERREATGAAPMPRSNATGAVLRGSGSLVLVGGQVESLTILDLWRLDDPFGGARSP